MMKIQGKLPCFLDKEVTEEEQNKLVWHRWSYLRLTLWFGATAVLAYLLWFSIGQATGGGDSPVQPWSCPAPPPNKCAADVATTTVALPPDATPRKYKLALWHEGYPVQYKGQDYETFAQYVAEQIDFAVKWRINRVYLQIYPPNSTATPAAAFSPENVAKHFLDPLAAAGIEGAFLAYINQKDTGWDRVKPLEDVAGYIQRVEEASARGGTISAVSFDKEDLGAMGDTLSDRITTMKASGIMRESLRVGYAGAWSLMTTAASEQPGVQELFAEMYWYGELMPHHYTTGSFSCGVDCVTAMPCFSEGCVTSIYRGALNRVSDMLEVLAAKISAHAGLSTAMSAQGRTPSHEVYALFSLEHLGGCCPERVYGPKDECGTFDGFALWDRDKFLELLDRLADNYGFTAANPMPIGLYEWQFIPPHWRDPSLSAQPVVQASASMATPYQCLASRL